MRDSANFSYLIIAYRRGIYNGDMGRPRGRMGRPRGRGPQKSCRKNNCGSPGGNVYLSVSVWPGTWMARYCSRADRTLSSFRVMETSMRRFWAWPSRVALSATGRAEP